MSRCNKFTNVTLNGYHIRAPTIGSLLVGGQEIGGGGGITSETSHLTSRDHFALFNGTDGNKIIDTGIYHILNEDNGAFIRDPSGQHELGLTTEKVHLQTDSGLLIELPNGSNDINVIGNFNMDGALKMNDGTIYMGGGTIEMGDGRIIQLNAPTESGEVANKGYVDSKSVLKTIVSLTQSDITSLHNYPGKTLVTGVSGFYTVIESLEFSRGTQGSAYTATGVNLYINYDGNYVDPNKSYTWKIPADGVDLGGTGLLTGTSATRALATNSGYIPFANSDGRDTFLMASSAITGSGVGVTIRVRYRLEPQNINDTS